MHPIAVNRASLPRLRTRLATPGYDPATLSAGILHLGLGGFHRAHMARYTHDLMELTPEAGDWAIVGAGLTMADRAMHDALAPQDGLYTLIERNGREERATIIGSLSGVLFAGESSAAVLDAMDAQDIRIVSLTVTEHGYCLDRATKRLDIHHPLIVHDLADPKHPKSAIGIVAEGYRRRMVGGRRAFTALSCDNIQHNGNVLRDAVIDFAERTNPALAAWIGAEGAFPNTMVDRITPLTQREDIAHLAERYGVDDKWPVVSEMFTQWVIEDKFVAGRPEWERVGAQFVADVTPYEFMKLRLLNASHLAIAGLGRLMGFQHVHEAMQHDLLCRYMAAFMDRETGPTLLPVPGVDVTAYKQTLVERFANPAIRDTLDRINADAPLNVLLDPIRDQLAAGGDVELLALALAAWLRRVRGEDEAGAPLEVVHPLAEVLRQRAIEGGPDPRPLLAVTQLFGNLGDDARLVAIVGRHLASLYANGAAQTLAKIAF